MKTLIIFFIFGIILTLAAASHNTADAPYTPANNSTLTYAQICDQNPTFSVRSCGREQTNKQHK
jgi:hypothetical protein